MADSAFMLLAASAMRCKSEQVTSKIDGKGNIHSNAGTRTWEVGHAGKICRAVDVGPSIALLTYFLPFPLALKVFNGSTLPFLPRTTFLLPPPFTNFLLPGLGMFNPTKPTSSGFLPPGSK